MNNPLNTPHSPNELVLRLIGGERDGQLFSVQNEKCLLTDLSPGLENAENFRCVIFRGEKGVAYRSYSDHVLCNGAKVSVQWLKKGDLIKVTDNFSVEVVQLGVYTKKPAAAPPAPPAPPVTRQPVNTVAIPDDSTARASQQASAGARPESSTIAFSAPEPVAPTADSSAPSVTPSDYAKPSVQFPSVTSPPTEEPPKFKPATANLRTPSVTAPLPTHQVPPQTPTEPAPSVSRMPVVTQALDLAASKNDSQIGNAEASAVEVPSVDVPSAPTNATIDSLSDRLSKLVNSAGEDGSTEFGDSGSTATAPPPRPSVSTMPIETTTIEPVDTATGAAPEAVVPPSPTVPQPIQPLAPAPNSGRAPTQTIPVSPVVPVVPAVPAAGGDAPAAAAAQPTASETAAQRRLALESYFSRNGVTLSDAITPPEDQVVEADLVSPEATQVAPATPAEPAAPPVEPAAPIAPVASVETPAVPIEQSSETSATVSEPASPEFDLDSVLANLETGSSTSSPQPPVVEAPVSETPVDTPVVETPVVETPVVETPVVDTPVVDTPVVDTPVAESALEQPPTVAANQDESSSDTNDGEQGGQFESFALLQSLGLDTSGLGEIKKEITEAPLREEIESISLNSQQQAEPEASEPEKVESVADVLARMQNAGSLEDFKASDDAESASEAIAQPQTQTPPPASPSVASTESAAASSVTEAGVTRASTGGGEEDGSVEDYMSQLLNRMRGDSEPTSGEVAQQQQDRAVEKIAAEQQAAVATEPEKVKKLTPEEFVPKQKAVRMQSLDSLREIANSNAREAFRDSLARERKVSTKTKLTLSLLSWGFALLFFLMSFMATKINYWGVVFGLLFLLIGVYTLRVYLSEKKLDDSIMSD